MPSRNQLIPKTIISGALIIFTFPVATQAADEGAGATGSALAPQFRVDPDWPKPLPNNWQVGQVAGVSVGPNDNIYVLHRPRSLSSSQAGATDAEPGVYVCNAQGELVERGTTCRSTDEFEEATAADAFGHPRPHGPVSDNSIPAPAVLKFDQEGNLLDAWGGPRHHGEDWGWPDPLWTSAPGADCQWPANEHGLHVDDDGHVYIAANGEGDGTTGVALNDRGWDGHLLKFSAEGECLLQVGEPLGPGRPDKLADSNDTDGGVNGTPQLFRAANMHVHGDNLYIADGYGNRRIVVVDKETGEYKRHWGAYGDVTVDDTAPGPFAEERPVTANRPSQFRTPVHCVRVADDNERIYVCDRVNNRIQVFDQSVGTDERCTEPSQQKNNECGFLFEKFVRADTLGPGSVWDLALSSDRAQSCVHQADGSNQRLYTLHRPTLNILDSFGESGRQAGAFHWLHDVAADSHGNLYTTEVDTGKRAQRFERVGRRNCREQAAED
ncbi:hypothetical protein [Sediminicurvatus halobius]|uniref:hypothetical protein n=1 Tax=Sediminicurvatus halobius TaxID=2182432 RepID=UPI0011B1FC3F|nr:hypothetical protein [Spiribacter halobius]UEX77883.1 hypothetical protein LMH63_18455 [Spiribacter halobius]